MLQRFECEEKLRKTYDRISLPDVFRRRQQIERSPHSKLELTESEMQMKLTKLSNLQSIKNILKEGEAVPTERISETDMDVMFLQRQIECLNQTHSDLGLTLSPSSFQRLQSADQPECEIPNFLDAVFIKDQSRAGVALQASASAATESGSERITMANQAQFKTVTTLFDDYYDCHEPVHSKYEDIKELRRRLNRKKVLNVNVIESENEKIKKENMGKGALISSSLRVDDPSMVMFTKELLTMLRHPNKEDKFILYKINMTKKKKRRINAEQQRALDDLHSNDKTEHRRQTREVKLAESELEKLKQKLESNLCKSPTLRRAGQQKRSQILKIPSLSPTKKKVAEDTEDE